MSIDVTTRLPFSAIEIGLPAGPPRLLEVDIDVDSLADQADEPLEWSHRRAASDERAFAFLELELVPRRESEALAERLGNRHLTPHGEP